MKTYRVNKMSQAVQAGFTLIELVVVIVILGILAATALPRFFDLTTDARKAAVAGVFGGFSAGLAMSHSKWLVDGSNIGTCAPVVGSNPVVFTTCNLAPTSVIEDVTIAYTAFGYPINTGSTATKLDPSTGLADTLDNNNCINIWTAVLSSGRPTMPTDAVANPATGTFPGGYDWVASKNAASCVYTYFGGAKVATARTITYTPGTGGAVLANN